MLIRRRRLLLVPFFLAAVAGGVVLEAILDPYEGMGLAPLGLLLGIVAGAGVGGWYFRKCTRFLSDDERIRAIEMRASRLSHGLLVYGVGGLAVLLWVPWSELPAAPLLGSLLVGSIVVHEVAVEYYRRSM